MTMTDKAVRAYLRKIGARGGAKGGQAKGKRKARGDSEYYKKLSAVAARARKAKARREAK
jgi:hypothetical protein